MKSGDFTGLAGHYSGNRPDYCHSVLKAVLGLHGKDREKLEVADVGAGTGIWTRMLHKEGLAVVTAIEPNDDMRAVGERDSKNTSIVWKKGSAEQTFLADQSVDLLTMASSFHWANFDKATEEFHRVLRKNVRFTALWNPRLIHRNPLLVEIDNYLSELAPDVKRVSSGHSGITKTLTERLENSEYFEDVVYLEGTHSILMDKDRYIGAWKSVNDLRVQLGELKFEHFLEFVQERISEVSLIEATYLTRAWSAKKT